MEVYIHTVQYYETDKMGIVHHSNYIRWMEEARVRFLDEIGWGYGQLENLGFVSPVVSVQCDYKATSTFGDEIAVKVSIAGCDGIRIFFGYEMVNVKTGVLVASGASAHCFLKNGGKFPVRIKNLPGGEKILKLLP